MDDTTRRPDSGLPTGLIAAVFFALGVLALFFLLRGDDGVDPLTSIGDVDIASLEERVQERLDPISLRPVTSLQVRVTDVRWRDGRGEPFLATPALRFQLRVGPALDGALLIHDGVVERPEINLVQYASGEWNYERVLAPFLEEEPGAGDNGGAGGGVRVTMQDILLRNGSVSVQLPEALYRATDVRVALASATVSGPNVVGPVFQVASANALLHLPDSAQGRVERRVAVEEAVIRLDDGAVAFQVESGSFGTSTFAAAEGVWNPALGGLGLDAALTVTEGRLADLPWLPGEVPEGTTGSFRLQIEPLGPTRTALTVTNAVLSAPGSDVTGSLTAVLTEAGIQLREIDARVSPLSLDLVEAFTGPLPYSGDVRGTITGTGGEIQFDVVASLATTPAGDRFQTDLTGRIAFTDTGLEVRNVTASLDQVPLQALQAIAPGLPLAGPITGTVSLAGAPGEAPIRLDVRLEAGGGIVEVEGVVSLQGAEPTYDLQGQLIGVDLRQVLEPAAPPVQVHADFALEGTGFEPATANAALALNGTFTGWVSETGDTLAVEAVVADGLLRTDAAVLELGPIAAAAEGEWRFAGGQGGAIRYDIEVASLDPLAPYLPRTPQGQMQFARGQLSAEGMLSGTLEQPVVEGSVVASDFRFGEWAAERFAGEYAAAFGGGLPTIEAELTGTQLRSPGGDFEAARLTVDFTEPDFEFLLSADQLNGGVLEIEAGGLIDETGRRQIDLRRAEVDLDEQRWLLRTPAQISWTAGGAVQVDRLRLEQTDGSGLVRVEGTVAPFDAADFEVEVRLLPVAEVLELIGSDLELAGVLSMEAAVQGPAEQPVVAVELALDEGVVQGVEVRSFTGTVGYDDAELLLEATGLLGDSARVDLQGTVPARLTLGLPPTFDLIDSEALQLRLATADFPLSTLDPGIRTVTEIVGRLDAVVEIGGTPDAPVLDGRVALENGALTVPLLDQRYERIHGVAELDGRVLQLDSLVAYSDGPARVTGRVLFEELTNPTMELQAVLEGFRPQGVDNQDDAAAWGTLALTGSVMQPRLTGELVVDDGTLTLAPFLETPRFSEAFVDPSELGPLLGEELGLDEGVEPGIIISDLDVEVGDELWFETAEARAQLSGDLVVSSSGNDFSIQGLLEGDQGTFTLSVGPRLTRRFEIVDATIRFFGGTEVNPALNIIASRLVRSPDGTDVTVRVEVGGTLNNMNLSLAAAEGVSLPESELFCYVALGRACAEASSLAGGDVFNDLFALTGVTDLLVSQLDVPVDYLQLEWRPQAGVEGLYLAVGEEIEKPLDDVYLFGEFPVSEWERWWEVSAEWRIDRQWTLELSYEPTGILRNTTTGQTLPDVYINDPHQFLLAIRRRWTY